MDLTLDQALQKGIETHKTGKAQEADRYYTAILKANPKHPDANHNMGELAVGIGKVETALPFFKTALEANSNVDQYWLSKESLILRALWNPAITYIWGHVWLNTGTRLMNLKPTLIW